jgi:hypothetical protein
MLCRFCFAEGHVPKLSKEHLLSKPVAEAFRVDRSAAFGHIGDSKNHIMLTRLSDASVRFVCEPCNNTWMNSLEHGMARLSDWVESPDQPLSSGQVQAVRSWALKTYLVLSEMVGGTRHFANNPETPGVLPNPTRARQLYARNLEAFAGMAFGLARPKETDRFAYAFGNPLVLPQGPRYANRKSAGLAIITLGSLQLWTVDPTIFHSAQIAFPKGVSELNSGLTYSTLRAMPTVPDLESVVVDNGEHDIVEIMDRVAAWAKAQSEG